MTETLPPNSACERCELCTKFEPKSVNISGRRIGKRNPEKVVLILSQSPGSEEDKADKVFVGKSGELLTEGLAAAGLTDAFITNPVRCYVKTGVTMKPAWVKACRPYLDGELEMLGFGQDDGVERFILALGNTALMSTLKRANVLEAEGKEQWSEDLKAWVFPLRHPAAVLRAMGEKNGWLLNFARFGRLVRGDLLEKPPVKVDIAWSLPEVYDFAEKLSNAERFTYDWEAKPVPWWHKDFVPYTIAFSMEEGHSTVVPLLHPESPFEGDEVEQIISALGEFMQKKRPKKAPWNGVYDDLVFYRLTGLLPWMNYDPMAAWHAIDENSPKSLKWNTRARLGWPDYDIGAGHDLAERDIEEVMVYNGYDSAGTLCLWEMAEAELARMPRVESYVNRQVMPMIRSLERMVARGVHINRRVLKERIRIVSREMRRTRALVPVENPGSPKQIAHWLYDQESLPILKLTKAGAPSTDEETVKKLALRFPTVRRVLDYRRPAKNLGKIGRAHV